MAAELITRNTGNLDDGINHLVSITNVFVQTDDVVIIRNVAQGIGRIVNVAREIWIYLSKVAQHHLDILAIF